MKAKEIAQKYGINQAKFETFLNMNSTKKAIKVSGLFSDSVADNDVPKAIELFNAMLEEEAAAASAAAAEAAKAAEEQRRREEATAAMLVTSGFSFDGYSIKRYSGYISGDDAIQLNRMELFNNMGQNLTTALTLIRMQAMKELKDAAYDLGCNAVIGVDFDYLTFEPETANASGGTTYLPIVVCVTANGNAVVIEKNT